MSVSDIARVVGVARPTALVPYQEVGTCRIEGRHEHC